MGLMSLGLLNLGIVFIWTVGSSFGIPGAMVYLVSAGAIAKSIQEVMIIILICFCAAVIGDITAYSLARKFSSTLSITLRKFKFFSMGEIESRNLLKKYAFSAVFLTRFFLTGLCAVVSYISGFEKLNRKKFIFAVLGGELIYASIFPLIGFVFKEMWNDIIAVLNDILIIFILIIIAVFLIRVLIKRK